MESILRISDLTKNYVRSHLGRKTISRGIVDLNFEVRQGEIFGLLGLNGSGKTTTLKLILGLLFPSTGSVELFGHPVSDPSSKKRIGYLPEVPYFYRHLSPVEVLSLYASLSKLDPATIPSRIDHVLNVVHMSHAKDKSMKEFSKGMLQRIGLAQAILHNPDFLILDEPVTGLDPLGIRQSRQLMADLNAQGKTILFSSHSISELERLAHRVAILVEGKLVKLLNRTEWDNQTGRLEEIFIKTLEEEGARL